MALSDIDSTFLTDIVLDIYRSDNIDRKDTYSQMTEGDLYTKLTCKSRTFSKAH
jgi:hypothetical protein